MLTLERLRDFCQRQEVVDTIVREKINQIYLLREDWQDACCSDEMPPVENWEVYRDEIHGSFDSFAYGDSWSEPFSFPLAWLFFPADVLEIIVEQHLEAERHRKELQERKDKQRRIDQLERELKALRNG